MSNDLEKDKSKKFIECLKTSKTKEVLEKLGQEWNNWQEWKFEIAIRHGGSVTLNALHVAIIMQNTKVSDQMLSQNQQIAKQRQSDFLETPEFQLGYQMWLFSVKIGIGSNVVKSA